MASKAELYEVKFKNKALKSKIEKFKQEVEQEKNKRWLYQARCQKAGQLIQRSLSDAHVNDGQWTNLANHVLQALEILAPGASAQKKGLTQVQRRAQPQKRDACIQIGPALKDVDTALLDSSNEIR